MRLLWSQHVYWTRMFIISTIFGLPDLDMVTKRLLCNPKDLEAAFMPFYGKEISAQIAELFTAHLTIAAELVNALKTNDTAAAEDAERRWYQNASQIADFLASINPHWSACDWKKMLYAHLSMTKTEVIDILRGNYQNSIVMFDNIEKQALTMADMMTKGIVQQFPCYFNS
ncbi:acetylglutamate kinase [Konateibacter massiliensis]|uniref:acetylglutamate kinase n=1 Tax=Konateibacter massiliensis TaxID=2002841 RepID=UPI000C147946|nr:acetylglutamate kinase [Konateibacter massiliensis]